MIARQTAQNATEAIWQGMVEIAEMANDLVVTGQTSASGDDTERISAYANDLAALATAASVLSRHAAAAP